MDKYCVTAAVLGFVITYNLSKRYHKENEDEEGEEEDEDRQES